MIKEIEGGVTAAKGYKAAGVICGVKPANKTKKDVALIVSEAPAACGAVFTQNKVPGAHVTVDKEQLAAGAPMRAFVVNSGNANACTGARGLADARAMCAAAARAAGVKPAEVLAASTGVIGHFMPMDRVEAGIAAAGKALSASGGRDAAEAIMTTDTVRKECAVTAEVAGVKITVGGMSKGSGMIQPNMATMLSFVTTDAAIEPALLKRAVKAAADLSFNRLSVDGDTSTNDTAAVLANGLAGNKALKAETDPGYAEFLAALTYVMTKLAKMMAADGEGATKFVEIKVTGAADEAAAVKAARAIANSPLVKTALHGGDANWGRIIAAVGYSGIDFDPERTEISFGPVPVLRKGYNIEFSEEDAARELAKKEIYVDVNLNGGAGQATFWTCDLSKEYIAINADYRS